MNRVFGNWTHWMTKRTHLGFNRYGKCWRFRFSRVEYSTCVYYTFWRFFFAVNK